MNSVLLIGRVGREPSITKSSTGNTIARFSIGINRYQGKDKEQRTDWPSIVCFGKTAELVSSYVTKGMQVGIEGSISTGSYEKDGKTVYTTEVIANRVEFLGSKGDSKNNASDFNKAQDLPAGGAELDSKGLTPPDPAETEIPPGLAEVDNEELPF